MKLYIGNLAFNVTQAQIQTLFGEAGKVTDVYLATNKFTSKSSGFAFVEMADDAAGKSAIERFHGYSLVNRPLTVQEINQKRDVKWKGDSGTVVYKKSPPPPAPPEAE